MKVWINALIKKVKLSKENFERFGEKVAKLSITFHDSNEIHIYLNKNDYKLLIKELPRE